METTLLSSTVRRVEHTAVIFQDPEIHYNKTRASAWCGRIVVPTMQMSWDIEHGMMWQRACGATGKEVDFLFFMNSHRICQQCDLKFSMTVMNKAADRFEESMRERGTPNRRAYFA